MLVSLTVRGLLAFIAVVVVVVVPSALSHGISQLRLNSTCELDVDCGNVENSNCHEGLCQCRVGYTIDGSLTRCLKVANGYYDTCEESGQCSGFLGAGGTCAANGQCVCTNGYHYLHGRCHETKGLDEACRSDDECFVNADYQAAACNDDKICRCSENYYRREYSTCRPRAKDVGDDCILDSDCGFDARATCVSNKCALDSKEARSLDERDEAAPTTSGNIIIGESKCESKADCKSLDHSICAVNGTCVCDRGYFAIRVESRDGNFTDGCAPEIGTSCDPQASRTDFQVEFAICKNNAWTCEIDRVAIKDNRRCRKFAGNIGASCNYPELCYLFGPRAKCSSNKRCECDAASHWLKDQKFCWKTIKIRDTCDDDRDCHSRGDDDHSPTCVSKVCTCPEGSKASDDGGYCYGTKPELGSYCERSEECEAMAVPNVSCENKKCACANKFFELNGQCVKGLGATCENDDECKWENSACYAVGEEKICRCSEDFTLGPDDICIEKASYKSNCTHDVQCSAAVKNSFCNTTRESEQKDEYDEEGEASGQCDCIADHYFNTDACYEKRWLGEECRREGECFTTTSSGVCRNGICSCADDFRQVGRDCKKSGSQGLFFNSWLASAIVPAILAAILS